MALFNAVAVEVRAAQTRVGCEGCTLANEWGKLAHPRIEPDMGGARGGQATVYFLGEAPGATEDELGQPFVGDSGQLLRRPLRNWTTPYVIGNTCRCRPPANRTPTPLEANACWKGLGEEHLLRAVPTVIVPLGGTALNRFFPGTIGEWVGVRVPHRIGNQTFWVYPLYHPSYLLRIRSDRGESDHQKLWNQHLQTLDRDARLWTRPHVPDEDEIKRDIVCVLPHELDKVKHYLYNNPATSVLRGPVGVDLETNGLMPWEKGARILSAAVSNGKVTVAWLIDHPENPHKEQALQLLLFVLDVASELIAHHATFEQRWLLAAFGTKVLGWSWYDTMSRPYAQLGVPKGREDDDKGQPGRLAGLGKQTRLHYGFDVKAVTHVDPVKWRQTPVTDLLLYNALDAKWTYKIRHEPLEPWAQVEVQRQSGATRAAAAISWRGMLVDQEELGKQTAKLEGAVTAETQIVLRAPQVVEWEIANRTTFNPASPDQVAQFYGLASADEEALRQVDDDLAKHILKLRKLEKLLTTYARGIKKSTYPDGYLHPDFSTMIVATGRWGCRNPNAQNMPKRENKEFRKVIVPPRGHALVSLDYAQLEARGIAMATSDAAMLGYVWSDQDIHKEWAVELLDAWPAIADRLCPKVTEEKIVVARVRGEIKNGFVFPSFYGAGVPKCAGELQVPIDVLGPILDRFWKKFAGARKWQDEVHAFYADNFFVETMTRRRRFAPLSWTEQLNSPIQGTGSDIVVDAAVQLVDLAVETGDPNWIPMVNVHDDLSFYLPLRELDRYIQVIAKIMVTPRWGWITVPLKVEVSIGHANWSEQHEFRSYTTGDFYPLPGAGLATQIRTLQAVARGAAANQRATYATARLPHASRSGVTKPNAARRERLALKATGLERVPLAGTPAPEMATKKS